MKKSKVYQAFQSYFYLTNYGLLIDDSYAKKRFIKSYLAVTAIEAYIQALDELVILNSFVYIQEQICITYGLIQIYLQVSQYSTKVRCL